MSRLPELRRIERAIEAKDDRELRWALAYCESRLSIGTVREHRKHWQSLLDRVHAALAVAESGESRLVAQQQGLGQGMSVPIGVLGFARESPNPNHWFKVVDDRDVSGGLFIL
jgi:hypothetical protein